MARRGEIRPLTSFRWIIGLALFVHHAVNFHMFATVGPSWKLSDLSTTQTMMHQGTGAVAFFFLLSGFTLTYNYADRFRSLDARSVCRFYVNRVGSIWPLHLLAFTLALVFVADDLVAAPLQVLTAAVPAVLLLQAWLPLGGPDTWTLGFNGPSWSLSALLFFYACFPVLVAVLGRVARTGMRWLLVLPVAWAAVIGVAAYAWRSDGYASWLFHTYPPVRLVDFVTGICAALIFLMVARTARGASVALPGGLVGATAIELGSVALVGAAVAGHDLVPLTVRYSAWYVLPLAVMVFTFARGGGLLSRAMGVRPLVYMGRISFAFLMLHVVVMQVATKAGLYAQDVWTAHALTFALSLALSVAAFHLWEGPARRFVRARGGA